MNPEVTGVSNALDSNSLTVEEKIASLFQPDMLLSAQYFENLRRKTYFEPEKRLMLALLEDAINCYQDNLVARGSKKKRLFEQTEQWILEANSDWVFSFDNVCETLGLNPEYVRQGLLRWKERNPRGQRPAEIVEPTKLAG
ncbi:MAG TPA: hypothetical protein VF977_03840 [Candidatus Binatia bacterium]